MRASRMSERVARAPSMLVVTALFAAAVAAAAATAAPSPRTAAAQEPGWLKIDVRPAFDGWYDQGHWVGIDVYLENSGPDVDVELRVQDVRTQYVAPVELPRGSVKRVPMALLLASSRDRVTLVVVSGGEVLARRQVNLRPTRGEKIIVLISSDDRRPSGLEGLAGGARSEIVRERPQDLPERSLTMGSVDAVVVAGADLTRLSEAQRRALYQWVALGGQLIVTGGPGASAVMAGLPEQLRPASVSGVRDLDDLSSLARWTGEEPIEGSAVVADLVPEEGAVVTVAAANGTVPLVVERELGDGVVTALAFDPALAPFRRWLGQKRLWLLLGAGRANAWDVERPEAGTIAAAVTYQPDYQLPSIKITMALIGIYIVLVGPINYVVLKRRRRLHLAWVTIPVLTIGAGVLAYGIGYAIHGGQLVTYEVSVVRVIPDAGVAHVTTYVGMFSPSDRDYEVRLSDGALAYAMTSGDPYTGAQERSSAVTSVQGGAGGVRDLHISQWALGGFAAEMVVDWPTGDAGGLSVESYAVTGEVRNPFGRDLTGGAMIIAGDHAWLGAVSRSFSKEISRAYVEPKRLEIDHDRQPGGGRDPQDRWMRVSLARSVLGERAPDPNAPYSGYPGPGYNYNYGYYGYGGTSVVETRQIGHAVVLAYDDSPSMEVDVVGVSGDRRPYSMYYARVPMKIGQIKGGSGD